ncbi:MAG: DUF1156 domain-containing protein, partial [Desulfobacterium sp.]|nr:DUF1156 domain-containing protein [Desulfobacterium sp.]
MALAPFEWKDKPALIEHLFPVQKISAESFKEQEARQSKTLTPLGSYWKGRKPLIFNKACILGSLLPVTANGFQDLEIFELLMGMDGKSMAIRHGRIKPADVARRLKGLQTRDWFVASEPVGLPDQTPFDIEDYPVEAVRSGVKRMVIPRLAWADTVSDQEQLSVEARALPFSNYKDNVSKAKRPEELGDEVHAHIWKRVNRHLGTAANSFPELIEQMGIARFGHRPKMADVFCGSGQIPFEAARLGCDVYASDLNPVACMLTWGAMNIVGERSVNHFFYQEQLTVLENVRRDLDALGVEDDGSDWYAKAFLYCVEIKCPETGWLVPLLPNLVSLGHHVVARLIPDPTNKRYDIAIEYVDELDSDYISTGSIRSDGPRQDPYVYHVVDGKEYRIKIPTIRGDNRNGTNNLRLWEKKDIIPKEDDIFRERLYAILWSDSKNNSRSAKQEFRSVTDEDLVREQKIIDYVRKHIEDWQEKGYVPDMIIEKGYNTDQPIRERGWTHWHHLFNPRQLLVNGLINKYTSANFKFAFTQILNNNSRLSRWNARSGVGQTASVFDNQALNTLYNYGCRGLLFLENFLLNKYKSYPLNAENNMFITTHSAEDLNEENDIYITDPPYGDAVKYEEITEFFIAWLRKNPPKEFAHWTWDSRRSIAIKGEDEGFRQGMVAAYRKMAQKMPDNGIQVLMFTHQSGSIWADM